MTQEARRRRIARFALVLLCAVVLYILTAKVVHHHTYRLRESDFVTHVEIVRDTSGWQLLKSTLTGANRLWHVLVKAIFLATPLNRRDSAGVVTGASNVAYYLLAVAVMARDGKRPWWLDPVAALALCLAGPLYAPWYSKRIYLGIGSPNIWHSPTQMLVEPFALLLFAMTVRMYSRLRAEDESWRQSVLTDRREAALYALLILVSVMAKPCCIQIFVPGLGLLMVIDLMRSRGQCFRACFQMACLYIPGVLLTVLNFVNSFFHSDGAGGLSVSPFESWSHYTKNIPFSVFLLMAFPIFVYSMDRRRLHDTETRLSLCLLAAGAAIHILLIEEGPRRWHGNLSWGHDLASTLIWFVAMKKFLRLLTTDELPKRERIFTAAVGIPLLCAHLAVGLVKVYQLMMHKTQY